MKVTLALLICLCGLHLLVGQDRGGQFLQKDMDVLKISPHVYLHRTFQKSEALGSYTSNGMIYVNEGKCLIFDASPDEYKANALIRWVQDSLRAQVVGVVVNHFHVDCMGGLNAFHKQDIPSYSSSFTQYLASKDSVTLPTHAFNRKKTLSVGGKKVVLEFLGGAPHR